MQYATKLYDLQNDAYDKGLEHGIQTGLARGRQEGIEQGLLDAAINMKKLGQFSDETIALATKLSLAQVQAIRV